MESWLIAQLAEISAINAEIHGMVAENERRKVLGAPQKYGEVNFQEKAQQLWGISNYIMQNRG